MKVDETETLEPDYPALLAACEAALDSSDPASSVRDENVPEAMRLDLERDLACVKLLRQAFPYADASASPTAEHSTDCQSVLPWSNLGRFEIRRELGRGSFGIVYLAYDPGLGREVALKIPRADALADPDQRHRFQREARAAAGLDHPNLVPVYEAGEVGPVCYIASAYCPGITLARWLKERDEPVPFQTAAELVSVLAEAVAYAHQRGVVHRDLKPGNILLQDKIPKITDFGLAIVLPQEPALSAQTQTAAIVGTANYMAPEQAGGGIRRVGKGADIYALGVILYELLTDRTPFQGDSVLDVLLRVRTEEPLAPGRLRRKVPRDLETICLKCLQKEPARRYARAGDLAEDLRRFLAGKPIQARPIRAWERLAKWARRRPAVAALLALVIAVAALGFGLVSWKWREAEAARREVAEKADTLEINLYYHQIALAERELRRKIGSRADELLDQCLERLRGWEWHYLKRLPYAHFPPLSVGDKEDDPFVTGVAFSPDGMQLAAGDLNGNVTVWDAQTGQERHKLTGDPEVVRSLAVSPVRSLAFSPDGKYLAAGGHSNIVTIWDLSTGQRLPGFSGHANWVVALVFSPDSRHLVSASRDRTVRVWDVSSRQEVVAFREHKREMAYGGLAFSADGRHVTSVSSDGLVKVWDMITGKTAGTFQGDVQSVSFAGFSPGGRYLALGSDEGTVKVFQTEPWKEIRAVEAHATRVVRLALSPDGRRLASTGEDFVLKVWDVTTGHEALLLDIHAKRINGLAFSPDGHRLASGSADRTVRVLDGTPWVDSERREPLTWTAHEHKVVDVAFSPDSQRLVSASRDKTAKIWELKSGARLLSTPRLKLTVPGFQAALTGVAFNRDGRHFAAASMDGLVKVCDAHTGQEICALDGKAGPVYGVAFSPVENYVASAHHDGTVKIWDIERGIEHLTFLAHSEAVLALAYSRDGRLLASAGGTGQDPIAVWEAATGKKILSLNPSRGISWSVAFSPDCHCLACVTGIDCPLIDVASGKKIRTILSKDKDNVYRAAFSPDGRRLAIACQGQTVRLWEVATAQELASLQVSGGQPGGVAFSPDGRYLAAFSGYKGNGTIQIWDRKQWEK
jgi:WD40 repeat protein